ncbi:hypothetical protein [Micromonospora sp. NBC_01813]|uniref:hypothetical protein n=1 Tax=Micromonospora sp. NBC_01813 TaxID=2975988 RepID=UPI002DDA1531|nr:hypothetical protein [Micromonospora sp. NBC_01813]WSA12022.1 hypothetical protein OG958_15280 [Micromonospora sp. NBC_01813]
MTVENGPAGGTVPVEDQPQYAQTAAYEWTERAYRLLLGGQLQARPFDADGVLSSHVWGDCPRCGHQLDHRQVHTAVAAGPGRQTGGRIIPPTLPTLEIDVPCGCRHTHSGAPDGTLGCGVSFRVEIVVGPTS